MSNDKNIKERNHDDVTQKWFEIEIEPSFLYQRKKKGEKHLKTKLDSKGHK